MVKKHIFRTLLALFTAIGLTWINPVIAALPPGNAVNDPYEILRNALPIQQTDLREIQHKIEDTGALVRGSRWPAVIKSVSSGQFRISNRKNEILNSMPTGDRKKGENIINNLKISLTSLGELANSKNKAAFLEERSKSLKQVGDLEALVLGDQFPYSIPKEFDNLPRLLGRANASIKTNKGSMKAVIDGYNAPLTSGAFVDLALKGFYDGLPINRAEEFFVLQTGDPDGPNTGYINPETNEERHVPLEIRVPKKADTIYNNTFEELGLYTETPVLPFAAPGALGWSHSGTAVDDGSSQFFFFLYDAELNPAGRNLIDGNNAAFGYVTEGSEILNQLEVDDQIISIKIDNGENLLKPHA
ncbi:peptidylprolyl isomerase [Prochlorococcus sp. MIT 1307]|uniref:peptidylprolyl isomerase n=1 Tax=Prochlorococcus sp. MIT 1307 TaxID=3096219 RepID=UPI002A748A45|nr:peptidylprolyl isomerase [Prochlorococcus sp. MIT 1307]